MMKLTALSLTKQKYILLTTNNFQAFIQKLELLADAIYIRMIYKFVQFIQIFGLLATLKCLYIVHNFHQLQL